jgi:RNase P/RNase MRP subunit p29
MKISIKELMISFVCVLILVLLSVNTDAVSKPRAKTVKKQSVTQEAENMQCKEITLIGVMSEAREEEIKDKDGKVIQKLKYCVLTDSKKKEWRMPRDTNVASLKEFEGKKVKIVGMILGKGSTLLSIKKMDKL